jgi:hypothetical protein
MDTPLAIKRESNSKGVLYNFFTLTVRRITVFTARNQAIFNGVAHTNAPFGGNLLNSRFYVSQQTRSFRT